MDIGVYIHIPFCMSKCYYCDFNSMPDKSRYDAYINALISEINLTSAERKNDEVKTLFIGGGTPTVLPPYLLDKLLDKVQSSFNIKDGAEWTIEANPGTLDIEKINILKKYKISRISLGMQSTHDRLLKIIGRRHTFENFKNSIQLIRDNTNYDINADIMFALPTQTLDEFKATINTVVDFNLEHISVYSLIIEEGTIFGDMYDKGELKEVDDDLDREMYHYAINRLKEAGYSQYEVSNFARPGKECRHNIIYWECEPYVGLGLGAHSLYGDIRYYNNENIDEYIKNSDDLSKLRCLEEKLTEESKMEEFIILGFRMNKGISKTDFYKKFTKNIYDVYGKQIKYWTDLGIIIEHEDRLYLSDYGQDISNEVFVSFIS